MEPACAPHAQRLVPVATGGDQLAVNDLQPVQLALLMRYLRLLTSIEWSDRTEAQGRTVPAQAGTRVDRWPEITPYIWTDYA